jgi:hypothetical protein
MPRTNFLFKIIDITFSPRKDLCPSFLVEVRSPVAVDSRIKVLFSPSNSAFLVNSLTLLWMDVRYQCTLPQAYIEILITFCEITKPAGHYRIRKLQRT